MRTKARIRRRALCLALLAAALGGIGAKEASPFSRALAAYRDRKLDEAYRYAKEAVLQEPGHVDAHALLGELYYLKQDLQRAQECWERALRLAPSRQDIRERLEKLKGEIQVERNLARSDTHPFVVRFADGQVPVDLGALRQLLRDVHRQVGQQFEYFPDHSITVILYPEADFQKVKGLSHQVAGLYDGKIRLPMRHGRMSEKELARILWHEYAHALVHDLAKGACPLWLNEGIATAQEGRVAPVDLAAFRHAQRQGKVPSWDDLWSAQQYREETLPLYYQTSYLLVSYLVKRWSWRDLVQLLGRLGQGYPIADALRTVYRTDPATLEQEWRDWLRRRL